MRGGSVEDPVEGARARRRARSPTPSIEQGHEIALELVRGPYLRQDSIEPSGLAGSARERADPGEVLDRASVASPPAPSGGSERGRREGSRYCGAPGRPPERIPKEPSDDWAAHTRYVMIADGLPSPTSKKTSTGLELLP